MKTPRRLVLPSLRNDCFCLVWPTLIASKRVDRMTGGLGQAMAKAPHGGRVALVAVLAILYIIAATRAAELLPPTGPSSAERLTIQYRSGNFQLLSRAPVIKTLPPSDELPTTNGPVSGFWFELQTDKGQVRYRRTMPDPLTVYTEVPAPGEESRPERAEVVPSEAVFAVLVPQAAGSNNLVLVSSPPGTAGRAQAAHPVARIPLPEQSK